MLNMLVNALDAMPGVGRLWVCVAAGPTRCPRGPPPRERMPSCGWEEFREKLHELRHCIDHAKRFCDGSVS
jgi:hypothetical protein